LYPFFFLLSRRKGREKAARSGGFCPVSNFVRRLLQTQNHFDPRDQIQRVHVTVMVGIGYSDLLRCQKILIYTVRDQDNQIPDVCFAASVQVAVAEMNGYFKKSGGVAINIPFFPCTVLVDIG